MGRKIERTRESGATFDDHEILTDRALDTLNVIYDSARDDEMARHIRELYHGESMIAVVGIGHLYALSRRLEDIRPRILTLDRVDD